MSVKNAVTNGYLFHLSLLTNKNNVIIKQRRLCRFYQVQEHFLTFFVVFSIKV